MTVKLTAEFVRTVTCERCGHVGEFRGESSGDYDGSSYKAFTNKTSPWYTSIAVLSVSEGWHGKTHQTASKDHGPQFTGDLCPACTETLLAFVTKFLADGIGGVVQMAKEEPAEEVEIPF